MLKTSLGAVIIYGWGVVVFLGVWENLSTQTSGGTKFECMEVRGDKI